MNSTASSDISLIWLPSRESRQRKRTRPLFQPEQPAVGNRYPMGVAGQVPQDLVWPMIKILRNAP
jgi:hypothetical protein